MNTAVTCPGLQAPEGPGLLTHLRDVPHLQIFCQAVAHKEQKGKNLSW